MRSENLTPTQAAEMILGFYDHIPAIDPEAFVAGLVEILSNYPQTVVDQAASPSRGLAGAISYPNLAKFREKLDEWAKEYYFEFDRRERASRPMLPEPEIDPVMRAKVHQSLRELAQRLQRKIDADQPKGKPFNTPTKEQLSEHYRQYGLAFQPKQQAAE